MNRATGWWVEGRRDKLSSAVVRTLLIPACRMLGINYIKNRLRGFAQYLTMLAELDTGKTISFYAAMPGLRWQLHFIEMFASLWYSTGDLLWSTWWVSCFQHYGLESAKSNQTYLIKCSFHRVNAQQPYLIILQCYCCMMIHQIMSKMRIAHCNGPFLASIS